MLPFLFIATRPEPDAANEEYELFQRRLELPEQSLVRWQLNVDPLPDDLKLEDYSGIVLAGGPFNATTPDELKTPLQRRVEGDLNKLVTAVVARDFPFFGACYGIGAVGSALGAIIDRSVGETASAVTITLSEAAHTDPLTKELPDQFFALVAHTEGCVATPPGATLLASSATCPVQMFRVGSNVYATQFHPETEGDDLYRRMAFYADAGYFDPSEYEAIGRHFQTIDLQWPPHLLTNFRRRYARERWS